MPALTRELVFDPASGTLLAERSSSCGRCSQAGHCAATVLSRNEHIAVALPADVAPGAAYTARFPATALLLLCAMVFPLLATALVAGAALALAAFPHGGDPVAAGGALAGLLVGLTGLKLYDSASGSRGILARLVIVPSRQVDKA